MGSYNSAVVTTAGEALFAAAVAGSETLEWTKAEASSYEIPVGVNLESLTSLQDVEQTADISYAQVINSTTVQISSRFTNEGVVSSYYIYALGFYAKTANSSETLMAVVTAISPDEQEAESPTSLSSHLFNVQMTFANASSVTLNVLSSGAATAADLSLLRTELVTSIATKAAISTLQGLDTPVQITVATTDWTASGVNWACTKSCSKATTDAYCVLKLVPTNPGTLTAAQLKTLQKNIAYLYPRPTVNAGSLTFLASTKPTIALTFDVVGGAVS